jgi:uncharacterized protein
MFVDTGAWYAAYVRSDPAHSSIQPLIDDATSRLITTDFVLAESLNLLRARDEFDRAVALGSDLFRSAVAELVRAARACSVRVLCFLVQLDENSTTFIRRPL